MYEKLWELLFGSKVYRISVIFDIVLLLSYIGETKAFEKGIVVSYTFIKYIKVDSVSIDS